MTDGRAGYYLPEMEVKCECCKNGFLRTPEWGWWFGKHICCSYHCMRDMERKYLNKRTPVEKYMPYEDAPRKRHLSEAETAEVLRKIGLGQSYISIAVEMGCSRENIGRIARKNDIRQRRASV